jgi:hypothetical protein
MTEAEWSAGANITEMVSYLKAEFRTHRFKKGQRRLRLFTCACCRLIWDLMTDERARQAVLLAEGYADGQVSKEEMTAAHKAQAKAFSGLLNISYQCSPRFSAADCAHIATVSLLYPSGDGGAIFGTRYARFAAEFSSRRSLYSAPPDGPSTRSAQRQADILRDVFGNPFRPPAIDSAWLRWDQGTVVKLARAIYEESAFERLPLLADALEDAGCPEEQLLGHLRSPGPHVRGCWGVDLLLKRVIS